MIVWRVLTLVRLLPLRLSGSWPAPVKLTYDLVERQSYGRDVVAVLPVRRSIMLCVDRDLCSPGPPPDARPDAPIECRRCPLWSVWSVCWSGTEFWDAGSASPRSASVAAESISAAWWWCCTHTSLSILSITIARHTVGPMWITLTKCAILCLQNFVQNQQNNAEYNVLRHILQISLSSNQ